MTNEHFERDNVTNVVDLAPSSCKMLQLGQAWTERQIQGKIIQIFE